jgi:hypothetical protein
MMLTPPKNHTGSVWLDFKKFQDRAQLFGKTLYHQGDLSYFEAVNKETLKNALTRFEDESMIVVTKSKDKSVPAMIRLAEEWMPKRSLDGSGNGDGDGGIVAEGPLWMFAEKISLSRREGKNRRDGATVQRRVLRLADLVGAMLWEEAVLDQEKVDEGAVKVVREKAKKRRKSMTAAARL